MKICTQIHTNTHIHYYKLLPILLLYIYVTTVYVSVVFEPHTPINYREFGFLALKFPNPTRKLMTNEPKIILI